MEPESVDYASSAQIAGHPMFEDAFRAFVDEMAEVYAHSSRMRGLGDFRQGVCFQLLVCFDAARDPQDPQTLFTTARVADAMAQMGVRDRRAVSELVRRLRDDGYATIEQAAHDGRVLELRATDKAREADREWLQVLHRPLTILFPGTERFDLGARRDPDYQQRFRAASLAHLPRAAEIMAGHPEADFFVKQTQGARILMTLMQAVRDKPGRQTEPGYYAHAATRCGVSATHIRKVLQEAEALGLVRLNGARAVSVEVLPTLEAGVRRWAAACLSATDMTSLGLVDASQRPFAP